MLTFADKENIAVSLNRLDFVRWDRFVESEGEAAIYGWIDRPDGRADFILLDLELREDGWAIGYTTSSADRSTEIGQILYGDPAVHYVCQRIDEEFGDLVLNKTEAA